MYIVKAIAVLREIISVAFENTHLWQKLMSIALINFDKEWIEYLHNSFFDYNIQMKLLCEFCCLYIFTRITNPPTANLLTDL